MTSIQKLVARRLLGCTMVTAILIGCAPQPEKPFTEQLREALKPQFLATSLRFQQDFTFKRSLIQHRQRHHSRCWYGSINLSQRPNCRAEGLSVNASDFVIEDLAIEDTVGDALKVNEGDNITIRRVRTEWTNGPDTENGA